ncbi:MAG: hypothetical protein ABSH32_05780 [Bryobacteraceae bacterium]
MFARLYGSARKGTLLESVLLGIATWTLPVVAPAGTVVAIGEGETTVKRTDADDGVRFRCRVVGDAVKATHRTGRIIAAIHSVG